MPFFVDNRLPAAVVQRFVSSFDDLDRCKGVVRRDQHFVLSANRSAEVFNLATEGLELL